MPIARWDIWAQASAQIERASKDEQRQQGELAGQTLAALRAAQGSASQLQQAIANTDANLNGPDVGAAIRALPQIATHMDATLVNAQGTMANVQHSTKQLDDKLADMLKPMSFANRVATGVLDWGERAIGWKQALK